jgi:hypothetical protein
MGIFTFMRRDPVGWRCMRSVIRKGRVPSPMQRRVPEAATQSQGESTPGSGAGSA